MPIQFVNLHVLEDFEKPTVNKLVNEYSGKIERLVNNPLIVIQFKKYDKAGKKVKYSIHARVDAPSLLASAEAADWDLARTLHKVFNKVESELKHKFKIEGSKFRKARAKKE